MNLMAQQMGMSATHYDNANGLKSPGQISSARDLAIIALYVQRDYPEYMPIFQTQNVQLGTHKLETSNTMLLHFAGLTGMKTGYICQSGLNIVATAQRDGPQSAGGRARRLVGAASATSSRRSCSCAACPGR